MSRLKVSCLRLFLTVGLISVRPPSKVVSICFANLLSRAYLRSRTARVIGVGLASIACRAVEGHCKFILTCNYKEKVIDPLQSRCQDYELIPPNRAEVGKHCVKVLEQENVEYDIETIATIIDACYPDIRRVINYLQKQSIDGKLNSGVEELRDSDYKLKLIELLGDKSLNKKDAFVAVRKLLMKNKVRDFTPLFSLMYDRLDKLADKGSQKADIILLLARYQNMDSLAVDKEINIMAMFVEILGVLK